MQHHEDDSRRTRCVAAPCSMQPLELELQRVLLQVPEARQRQLLQVEEAQQVRQLVQMHLELQRVLPQVPEAPEAQQLRLQDGVRRRRRRRRGQEIPPFTPFSTRGYAYLTRGLRVKAEKKARRGLSVSNESSR